MVSSRSIQIDGGGNGAYGLRPERAQNFGVNLTHSFRLARRDGQILFDLYHTRFTDQVVADYDLSPQQLWFYNLEGKSYSTSAQIEVQYQPKRRLDVKLAYRWLDVRTDYRAGWLSRPLVAPHRIFANVAYKPETNGPLIIRCRHFLRNDFRAQTRIQRRFLFSRAIAGLCGHECANNQNT